MHSVHWVQAKDTPSQFTTVCQPYTFFCPLFAHSFLITFSSWTDFLRAPVPRTSIFELAFPVFDTPWFSVGFSFIFMGFFPPQGKTFYRTIYSSISPLGSKSWSWFFWPANYIFPVCWGEGCSNNSAQKNITSVCPGYRSFTPHLQFFRQPHLKLHWHRAWWQSFKSPGFISGQGNQSKDCFLLHT